MVRKIHALFLVTFCFGLSACQTPSRDEGMTSHFEAELPVSGIVTFSD